MSCTKQYGAYRKSVRESTRAKRFFLVNGTKAAIPTELIIATATMIRRRHYKNSYHWLKKRDTWH